MPPRVSDVGTRAAASTSRIALDWAAIAESSSRPDTPNR